MDLLMCDLLNYLCSWIVATVPQLCCYSSVTIEIKVLPSMCSLFFFEGLKDDAVMSLPLLP